MKLYEYLQEDLDLSELHRDFGKALKQVFSEEYLNKIQSVIKRNIVIKEKDFKNPSKAAYVEGRTIFVNKPVFDRLSSKERVKYLMHEFIHIMQNTKNFFVVRAFEEVYDLGDELYKIVKRNLKGSIGEFLTGAKNKISSPKYEIISYLMNGDIDWTQLTMDGKREFIIALNNSKMFRLNTVFWKERLL